jgi:hypothetical protein
MSKEKNPDAQSTSTAGRGGTVQVPAIDGQLLAVLNKIGDAIGGSSNALQTLVGGRTLDAANPALNNYYALLQRRSLPRGSLRVV